MPQRKILVIEDSDFAIKIYKTRLEQEGFDVIATPNASEAGRLAQEHKPALCIVDLMLTYGNGFEAIADIRNQKNGKKVPIFVISNLSQQSDIDEAISRGASQYFVKSSVSLQEVIDKAIATIK